MPPSRPSWSATWDFSNAEGKVVCSTIHGFKGLERPVVIVCGLDNPSPMEEKELLYVAFSRARSYLAVVGWKGLQTN
jgi:superfamily I DNA/RNA helicase